ncbi:MAG: hypothetical protein HZB62_10805 [Nitrospirae bacterium]|nr:hypothetical protein [Nitrospirota bacterium]
MAIVKIEIISDTTKSVAPLREVSSACDKVKSSVVDMVKSFAPLALGTAVIAKLSSSIASAVPDTQKLASEIGRLQRITGMSAETASEYIAVFDQVGVSFGALQNSVTAIARKMGGLKGIEDMVTDASGQMVDVFEKFDIQIKNSDGSLKSFSDVFEQIRVKIKSASSETERMAIATQFFKGNAVELMPVLTMSASQWKEIADDAKKYGIILSQDNVNAVKQYTMAQRDMDDAVSGLKLAIGNELIPILKEVTLELTENIASVRDFVSEHRALLSLPWEILKTVKNNFYEIAGAITVMMTVAKADAIALLITRLSTLSTTLVLTTAQAHALGAGLALLAGYEIGKLIDEWTYKLADIDISGMNKVNEALREAAEEMDYLSSRSGKQKETFKSLGFEGAGAMKQFNEAVKSGTVVFDQLTGQWIKQSAAVKAGAGQTAEEIKKIVEALSKASAEIEKIGEAQLKIGGDNFTEALKKEETSMAAVRAETERYGKSMATIADKSAAMQATMAKEAESVNAIATANKVYLNVIESVYARRLAGERAIAEAMKKAGADPAALATQQTQILQTEMAGATARLGAWKQYYITLEGLHKRAIDEMARLTQEQAEFEKSKIAQLNGYADLQNSLRQQLMTDQQKYYDQLTISQMKFDAAMQLSGQEKINALKDWQATRGSIVREVTEGDAIVISKETAVRDALRDIAKAQDAIVQTTGEVDAARQQSMDQLATYTQQIETAMSKAAEMVEHYKASIIQLDSELAKQRELSVNTGPAQKAIESVIAAMAEVKDKTVTITVLTNNVPAGGGMGLSSSHGESVGDVFQDTSVNVDFTGTGSPKKPLTEKLNDYQQQLKDLSGDIAHNFDFSGLSRSISSVAAQSQIMGSAASQAQASATDDTSAIGMSSGMTDGIAKVLEELYMKLAAAEGRVAFAEQARKNPESPYYAIYATQIAENEAIIRTLEQAISKLLSSAEKSADDKQRVSGGGLQSAGTGSGGSAGAFNPNAKNNYPPPPSQGNITFAPIINIHGTNKNPEQLAREIARPLEKEFRRLLVLK